MAHTYVNKSQANTQSGNPITHNHTPGSAATVAILSIVVVGTTARTGGAPTIDGTTATQHSSGAISGYEHLVELWYVCKAFSGSQFTVSIPNSNGVTCHVEVVTAYAGSGNSSELYSQGVAQALSNIYDGLDVAAAAFASGDFVYARLECGEAAVGSVTTNPTGIPSVNLTYANDHGQYTSFGHYGIADAAESSGFSYVWTNDYGAVLLFIFKTASSGTTYTKATTLDSVLQKLNQTKGTTLDGLLQKPAQTKGATLDAYLKKTETKSVNLDAFLKKILTSSTTLDGVLSKADQTKSTSIDALLTQLGLTRGATLDAILYAVTTQYLTTTLDGVLSKADSKTTTVDAILSKPDVLRTLLIDAYLQQGQTKISSLDALLLGIVLKTVNIDSLLNKVGLTKASTLDSLLQKLNMTKAATLDAVLLKSSLVSLSLDAILFAEAGAVEIATTLDALLNKMNLTRTVTIDSFLQKLGLSTSASLDAFIFATSSLVCNMDALLQQSFVKPITLDAFVSTVGTVRTTSLEALLLRMGAIKTTLVDALLYKTASMDTVLDAFLYRTVVSNTMLDVLLQKLEMFQTVTLDAILVSPAPIIITDITVTLPAVNPIVDLEKAKGFCDLPGVKLVYDLKKRG